MERASAYILPIPISSNSSSQKIIKYIGIEKIAFMFSIPTLYCVLLCVSFFSFSFPSVILITNMMDMKNKIYEQNNDDGDVQKIKKETNNKGNQY